MSDDPKPASEPTTEEERAPTTDEETEPDMTDMDATGDDGQVFGG